LRINTIPLVAALALLAGLAGTASATPIIFNNGLPNQTGGSDMNAFLEADNFSLGSPANLTLIRFWSLQGSAGDYAGSIEWSILSDAGGTPGAIAASGTATPTGVATGNSALGLLEFRYDFAASASLGTSPYWLVLHNGPSSSQPATSFYWTFSNDQAGDSQSFDLTSGGSWIGNNAELAFQLEGEPVQTNPVPEPASLLLTGAGIARLLWRRSKGKVA
jgi:hypothetical protein